MDENLIVNHPRTFVSAFEVKFCCHVMDIVLLSMVIYIYPDYFGRGLESDS